MDFFRGKRKSAHQGGVLLTIFSVVIFLLSSAMTFSVLFNSDEMLTYMGDYAFEVTNLRTKSNNNGENFYWATLSCKSTGITVQQRIDKALYEETAKFYADNDNQSSTDDSFDGRYEAPIEYATVPSFTKSLYQTENGGYFVKISDADTTVADDYDNIHHKSKASAFFYITGMALSAFLIYEGVKRVRTNPITEEDFGFDDDEIDKEMLMQKIGYIPTQTTDNNDTEEAESLEIESVKKADNFDVDAFFRK